MELLKVPRLEEPVLMAAWPGMGLVAYRTVSYLAGKLGAKPLPTADEESGFPMAAISIENGLVKETKLPQRRFFHARQAGACDLVLFLGEEQPASGREWSHANQTLDIGERLGCRMLYTFAAMPRRIDHHREPAVWGTATHRSLLEQLEQHGVQILEEGTISGLNGVLLGVAKTRGWQGCCLLGEIPLYATQLDNPKSCLAILDRVVRLTGIEVDLSDLERQGEISAAQLDLIFQQLGQQQEEETEEQPEDGGPPSLLN